MSSEPISKAAFLRIADKKPLDPETIFQRALPIEHGSGPAVYKDVLQSVNFMINQNPSGIFLSRQEFKLRAACLAWLAGVFGGKTLDEVLNSLEI